MKAQLNLPKIDPSLVDISYQQENYQVINTIYSGGKLPYTKGKVDYSDLWLKTAKGHFELTPE